jgi:uncharacterized protein (TIGR02302 family)
MNGKLGRTILKARLALFWEKLWDSVFPALMVVALFAIAVLTGLLANLPELVRYGALILFAAALLWAVRPIFHLVWPERSEVLRRIERESALDHRPVSAMDDRLAEATSSAQSADLWEAHRLRQLARLDNLKAGAPHSSWKRRDPVALRLGVGLALVAAIFLHRGDPAANLIDSVRIAPRPAEAQMALDAWIRPPAYTQKAPLMLTSAAMIERLKREGEILVPEASQLVLRLTGASAPKVAFFGFEGGGDQGSELTNESARIRTENGAFTAEAKFDRPMRVVVSDDSGTLAEWKIAVIPDQPPKIAFQGEPEREATGALQLGWKATDDYGVAGVSAKIALSDAQEDGPGIAADGVFLFDPPQFPISLKRAAPREIADTSANDLTAHPWAGLNVDIALEARDQAGRIGESETKTVKLPEREFFKPLARALIEQRKALILNPNDRKDVVSMLDALLAWPDGLIDRSGIQIAISAVRTHIVTARDHDGVRESVDDLWKIALAIEEGDMADLRAQLEALQRELKQALAEGASPERIAELMDKLRETMNKYLEQMAEETRRQMQNGQLHQQQQQMQPGQMISPEDLQKMLDTIQKLAESGANEAAQEMLSQLESLLRNLKPGMAGEMPPQGDTPMSQMLGDLSELMRRQQQLMDETMRMPGGEGDEMQQGEGDQQGQQGRPGRPGDKLAGEQDGLGQMLQDLMGALGQQGMNAPPSFGDAQKSMKGASGSLRGGERDPALDQQSDALNALREGAQNMARQMMQQGQGQQGNYGRHGEARGDDRDPLGRPRANRGEDYGPERNMLPGEAAILRAREILEMLRSRAGMPDLPRIDRDYIDRLLRGLY